MGNEIPNLSEKLPVDELKKNKIPVTLEGEKLNKAFSTISIIIVLVLGILSGYFLARKSSGQSVSLSGGGKTNQKFNYSKGQEFGITKNLMAKDTATGIVESGGLEEEGTHHLSREGGPSQTVYLTSSALDLDRFVGQKVQIWGETNKLQKAGWFMDVLKIKIL